MRSLARDEKVARVLRDLHTGNERQPVAADEGAVARGAVTVAIRPEGFVPNDEGAFHCPLTAIEVMGRDISVVCAHPSCENAAIRAIISAESKVELGSTVAAFDLKPYKVFLFDPENGQRISFEAV